MINEELARRNKENHSFSDYVPGSATNEYNQVIAKATQKIEAAKLIVSDENKARLDTLLERYKVKYAEWINNSNANGARHVSVMISGSSNYPMGKHEKYLSRERTLWGEYDHIKDMINDGISRIINCERIISSDNPNAIELLKEKIAKLERNQEMMKAANKIIRSKSEMSDKINSLVEVGFTEEQAEKLFVPDCYGGIGFEPFELTNNSANIRRLKQRLEGLERKHNDSPTEKETDGIKIFENVEANRVQIFFPSIPASNVRNYLKSNGFHWSPSNSCWQRMRSVQASHIAEKVIEMV
ncbi:hypothetical protein EDC14_1004198 [Hydrogenispora ethanolica]|uniref:Uncharacterized protein n=1 Tax=Hydrogenispora ethanolica TaxID=1082276 RepID=A0A4R1S645_HYDET|nr:hypothetical protein [Hydrogenispora ethanolica]TCL74260.1 hypothetical protein EDC14_1004198 [Hydrogenispora ethanolica]